MIRAQLWLLLGDFLFKIAEILRIEIPEETRIYHKVLKNLIRNKI